LSEQEGNGLEGIAIVGMAGRFPRAADLEQFWRNLTAGLDCVSYFQDDELEIAMPPELLRDPNFVKARGVLDEPDLFDARFFDISPRQAELMDPQNRLFLECAHQALEDAGIDPERYPGAIGVFGGVTMSSYFLFNLYTNPERISSAGGYQIALGTDRDYLTTFVSYKLNLRGPSLDVQTACSTSLVATVLACQNLLSYTCDVALAGGVSVKLPQKSGYMYQPGGLDSLQGRCRAFDAGADGSVYGGGVGIVVLKRLEDAVADGDTIHAVILGAALNNDGSAKVGFTAPGIDGQAEVIATAQALAGVDPESIGYVECHGSGTALGDPIEVTALTKAFRAGNPPGNPENERTGYCAIGSVKTNIGHCSAAAGVAGLLKAALALEHRQIPPSLHFERPNPAIDFANSPFYVADRLIDWEADGTPRRAGVSSFGLGGTNAHIVLQEPPELEPSGPSRPWQLLLLSAKTETALETATGNLAADLEAHPERSDRGLADVAFTLQTGRRIFGHRRMLVCRDAEDARRALAERDPRRLLGAFREEGRRPVAFLLPGVGDHYAGMAHGLYGAEPTFREHLDRCAGLLRPRFDLLDVLFPAGREMAEGGGPDLRRMLGRAPQPEDEASRRLHRTLFAQPAVFAVEYALAQVWMEWGIQPETLLGYSLGEYTAACLAGVLSLEDALLLVAERARLIDDLPAGAMLAVSLPEERVRPLLGGDLDVSAINSPGVCVVSGPEEAVARLRERLDADGVSSRRLPTTHAFHSRAMAPVAPALDRLARSVRLAPPRIPYVSNVTGTWITNGEATDPGYWVRHLRQPVRFAQGLATLWKSSSRVLLEVGPGFGLSTLALQQAGEVRGDDEEERLALPSLRNEHDRQPDEAFLLGALGRLWLAGVDVDWKGFYAHERRRRVRLPTYPFERQRYWIEPGSPGVDRKPAPQRQEVVEGALTGDAFERAREIAPGTRLVLVEDDEIVRRIARLRELEALGAEVVVVGASEAAELPASPVAPRPAAAARYARPSLRNAYVAPESEREVRVAGLFQELLGVEPVGLYDSFFELGGHSLLGTSMLARVRDLFGVELPLRVVFESPTVAGLVEAIDRETAAGPRAPEILPVPRDGEIPLSYAQQRLWFLDRLMPGNPFYNLSGGMLLSGPLDVAALRRSVQEMVRRHETLRTGFAEVNGRPVQRIAAELEIPLPLVDLTGLPDDRREEAVRQAVGARALEPYDLGRPGLLRITLLRLEDGGHALLFGMHHIVSDAWSMGVLVREVAALYAAASQGRPSPLPGLPFQYADFAAWQRSWLSGEVLDEQLRYWRERLTGAPALELPADRPRPPVQSFRGATLRVSYPRTLAEELAALARRQDVSLFMVLFAAFQTLLGRYTGEDDVVVGSPIANRTHSGLEGLIGFFVNTLVLRTDLSGDPGFLELIGRVREVSFGAHAHQDLPFEQLVEELQPRRDLSRNPLFQVMFNLINVPAGRLEASDLAMSPLPSPGGTALFDIQAYVTETGEGLDISWEYATDLFERETIERFSRHFETLLAGAAAGPERRLSELPLLTSTELAQLGAWNDSAREYPADLCAHQLIEAQVRRTPEAVALVDESGERLTYSELNDQADRLAGHLRRQGVGPGTLVAVSMERSAAMVAALFAVWKAGGAYVPLDPSYPAERISYILEDSGALMLDATESNGPAGPLEPLAGPEELAYVIYTSGSTGRPKGVEVRHGGLVNFLASMAREPGLDAADVLLAVTTISFDIAGLELWLPLTIGARVALASRDTAVDGARLAEALAATGATLLQATPATWRLLLASGWTGSPCLKALCGGEALPPDLAREIAARTGSLWNVYGPTETTVWSALQPVRGDGPVPVGRPIANTTLHLAGRSWELVPVGALGEIWIGGAGLSRGYLGRPELTAGRFVPDPFGGAAGARLYRTGDLARRLPDGTIEFLGRLDHQVKIRGFRVELGEIEAALTDDPTVREAAVAIFQEAADDQRLVAYLVREPGFDLPDPRQTLLSRLPSYMVPSVFVELEALPLTPSGKVDRKALPRPDISLDRDRMEPRTPAEIALAGIWAEVLGVGEVGTGDDFFALGGHSLLGTRVMARIRQVLEVDLPLRALFEHPTLAALARAVEQEQGKAQGLVIPPLRPPGEDGPAPLSFAQQRLWFMDRLEPGSPFYTLFTAVRLSGGLDVAALRQALDEIVRRHESLRTAFVEGEQGALQIAQPARPLDVPLIDLEALGGDAREAEARRLVAGEAVAPFDLGSGTLLRCRLLRLGGREHAVTCAMHHIASDFLSLQIFVQELAVLYDAFSHGKASPLLALPVQYADFSAWQRGWLTGEVLESEIAWWKERLTGAPSRIELRADRPRSEAPDFRGATRAFELPAPLMETLQAVSRAEGCTLFMTLLAAFEVLLHHGSGQDDLVVGTPVGYRNWPEIEGAIGLFANTLALRADLGGDPTFRELMARVRRIALGAFAHQHVPFERLVEELRPERSLSHNPLFQVTFNFVAAVPGKPMEPMEKKEAPSLSIAPFVFERETAQFDLSMLLVEGAAGAAGSVQYKTGLFDGGTIGWMLEQFRRILDRVAVEPDVRLGELRQMLARADEERRAGIDRELEEASFQKFKERRRRAVPALT
jgi:amino acid adenylation domain-containing protein